MPIFRILVLSILLSCAVSGIAQNYNAYVKSIATQVDKINNDKTLEVVTATDASGTQLTGYFLYGRELVRITATTKTAWGIVFNEYYFEKDLPIYIYESEKKEMPDPETDELKLNVTYTGGFYYQNGNLIQESQVVGLKQPLAKKETRLPLLKSAQQYGATLKAKKASMGQ